MLDRQTITTNLPGDFKDTEILQRFTNNRKFAKGYRFATATGTQTFENMQFPGSARLMLGFAITDTSGDPNNRITININEEDIVSNVSWANFTKTNTFQNVVGRVTGSSYNDEFYIYLRALSGNDAIKITYTVETLTGFLIPVFYFKTLNTFKKQI